MTAEQHKAQIAINVANANINTLVADLGEACAKIDSLSTELKAKNAEIDDLKSKLAAPVAMGG